MRGVAIALLALAAVAQRRPQGKTTVVLAAVIPTGKGPADVAVNRVTNRIYVANQFSGTVTVIDQRDRRVLAQVAVGKGAWGVGVDETADRVYVADFFGTNVQVIDGTSDRLLRSIPVGVRTSSVAVDAKARRAYFGSSITPRIVVVDTRRRKRVESFDLAPHGPADIAVDPASRRIYFVSFGPKSVLGYLDGKKVKTVPLPSSALRFSLDASGKRIYVPLKGRLLLFRSSDLKQVGSAPLPGRPAGVAVNAGLDRVYVALRDAAELAVYRASNLELLRRVPAGAKSPLDVAVNARTGGICVSMRTGPGTVGSVAVFLDADATTLMRDLRDRIRSGGRPDGVRSKAEAALAALERGDTKAVAAPLRALRDALGKLPETEAELRLANAILRLGG